MHRFLSIHLIRFNIKSSSCGYLYYNLCKKIKLPLVFHSHNYGSVFFFFFLKRFCAERIKIKNGVLTFLTLFILLANKQPNLFVFSCMWFHQMSPAFRGYCFVQKPVHCYSTISAYIILVHLGMRSLALYLEAVICCCSILISSRL